MAAIIQITGTVAEIIDFARLLEAGTKALSESVHADIHNALLSGKKVEAIKLHRGRTGQTLVESRDFIESLIGKTPAYQEARRAPA